MKKILLAASFFTVITASAQTLTQKASISKGQQLEEISKVNMNITQEMAGQSMDIKVESTFTNLVEVKDASASGFALSNTLKKVLMNMKMMGQDMTFDSDKKEDMDGQLGQAYKGNLNMPKEYTISKAGLITEIKGSDAKAAEQGMMENIMSGIMDVEKVGAAFHSFASIPAKGIKKGESWSDSASDGKNKTTTTYTFQDIKGNDGLISINSMMVVDREIEQQGMKMQMAMKGTTIGEYTFDVASGIIKTKKATTKASGNVEVMGQSVPMTLETVVVSNIQKK